MSKLSKTVRWICVIPGAVLGGVLVAFPVHWVVMLIQLFGSSPPDGSLVTIDGKTPLAAIPPDTLERCGLALFAPFAIVWSGAKIAPNYRFATGIALAIAVVIGLIAGHVFILSQALFISEGWFHRTITYVLQVIGLSWGLSEARKADAVTVGAPITQPQVATE